MVDHTKRQAVLTAKTAFMYAYYHGVLLSSIREIAYTCYKQRKRPWKAWMMARQIYCRINSWTLCAKCWRAES